MTILEIIQLVIIVIVIISILAYCIIVGIKNKWLSKLLETTKIAIKEAETKFTSKNQGNEKKEYVLQKVESKCKELKIPYKLLKKLIELAIDTIVDNYNVISK